MFIMRGEGGLARVKKSLRYDGMVGSYLRMFIIKIFLKCFIEKHTLLSTIVSFQMSKTNRIWIERVFKQTSITIVLYIWTLLLELIWNNYFITDGLYATVCLSSKYKQCTLFLVFTKELQLYKFNRCSDFKPHVLLEYFTVSNHCL